MIIDLLENLEKYVAINPLFADVVSFLATHRLDEMEDGKHPIKGNDLFLNLTTVAGKTPDKAVLETHREMIDIQIPLSDAESYGYTPLEDLPKADYDEAKDLSKYPGLMAQSYVECRPGMMAVFFPQDGHAPCIAHTPQLRKAIFKVKHVK